MLRQISSDKFLTFGCLLIAVAGLFGSCDRWREPSRDDCEVAIDHFIELIARDSSGGSELSAVLVRGGTRWLSKATGDYDTAVKKCMRMMSVRDIKCTLRASTVVEAEECGF